MKNRLLATTLMAGFAGMAFYGPATAQEVESVPPVTEVDEDDIPVVIEEVDEDDEARQEKVIVTGSRLARDEFSSVSPIQVIDGEVARDLGLVDAADLLNQTTVVQGQQTTTGLSTSAGVTTENGPGAATASLRGLDPGRTLVLVNGRRLAPAGVRGAPSAPDLNLIPGSLIERVDVLLDGASSVYGSDAVAGVVNYIMRSDFDGLQLDAFVTDPEMRNNAGQQQVYSATFGTSNDRGFIGAAVEYSRSQGITEREFGSFYESYTDPCQRDYDIGASGQVYEWCSGSFGEGAGSVDGIGFVGFDLGRNTPGLPPNFFPIPVTGGLLSSDPDNFNGQALLLFPEELDASYAPDFERTTLFTLGEYNLGLYGDMTAYFEASHSIRTTETNTSGQGRVRLPATYPLNQFGVGATLYYNSKFDGLTEVAQTRLIGGLKGELPFMDTDFGFQNWSYDMYASFSHANGDDSLSGLPFFPRLLQTYQNTVIGPDGQPTCTSENNPGTGQTVDCRPLNFFEPNFILGGRFLDSADNEYLFPNRITNTIVEQSVITGYMTGELFQLPDGAVGGVVGFEYREDEIETRTDAGASAGDFLGFLGDPGSNGSRALREAFGEIEIPLLKDRPFAHDLSFNLAGRYTEEDNFGSETTYRIQGQYAPTEWLRARATFGTSFRAPNLGEQFGGRVTGFQNPQDPCRVPGIAVPFGDYDNDPSTPDTREYVPALENRTQVVLDNCTNGGGPFNIPGTDPTALGVVGLGTTNPVFPGAPTQVASGSNPDLKAETSEALSAGIVFEQPFTDAFDLRTSVTYFEIVVEDEVDTLTAQTIVGRCYNSAGLTDPQCAFITRDPRVAGDPLSGEVSFVTALNQNLGEQTVEGIDYNVEFGYEFDAPRLDGDMSFQAIARATQSLTQDEEQVTIAGTNIDDDLGEYGNPEWRFNLTNILSYNDYALLFQSRYIGDMIEDNVANQRNEPTTTGFSPCVQAGDTPCTQFDDLDDYWVHDMSLRWSGDTWVLRGGVTNIFDEAPPITDTNDLRFLAGIGYDFGGRTLFLNATKRF